MYRLSAVLCLLVLCAPVAYGQNLRFSQLQVGAKGRPQFIDAKVLTVIDDKSVLLGMEDAKDGNGRYDKRAVLAGIDATKLTDGDFFRDWSPLIGKTGRVIIRRTTRLNTIAGGTLTVLLLERTD